ncbi:MAG: LpxI family protein [Phycisphaerae bacterium]|jgi:DUF1009 family protein
MILTQSSESRVVGLIAGQGRLPYNIACAIRRSGAKVACVAIAGNADPALEELCDFFHTVPISRLGNWIKWLRRFGASETIMAGRVAKADIYSTGVFRMILSYLPDWRVLKMLYRLCRTNWQNDTILCAIADELATGGINLVDSTKYSKDNLADKGLMTTRRLPDNLLADIEYGWEIVKEMGRLDVGQAIAVKNKEVIAVEAIEGTAKMIERAGKYCKSGGWTLIKTAKPGQDMRFDVPCIGVDTILALSEAKAGCVVIEAGKTFIIDKADTIMLADKLRIPIYGH